MSTPVPVGSPSAPPLADVFAVYAAALSPDWFRQWYEEHQQSGGGGIFSPSLTLWLMLTQHLLGGSSLEAVLPELRSPRARQLSPNSRRLAAQKVSSHNSGYCYARQKMPVAAMQAACAHLNQQVRQQMQWPAQPVYLLDGSSVQVAARPALRQRYPPGGGSKGDGHWPLLRLVVIHERHTGLAATPPAWGGAERSPRRE